MKDRGGILRANEQDKRLRFGVFEDDIRSGELAKRGRRVRLQEQPFQLLAMLLERPGELLTREELSRKLWPNTVVDFDHGLNKAVAKIREALGDSAENPRFIETVARRGYRFLADVTVTGHGQPQIVAQVSSPGSGTSLPGLAEAGTSPRRPPRAWRLLGLGLGLLLVAVLSWSLYPRSPSAPAIRSLAVLPLENLSGDPSQDALRPRMTDA